MNSCFGRDSEFVVQDEENIFENDSNSQIIKFSETSLK